MPGRPRTRRRCGPHVAPIASGNIRKLPCTAQHQRYRRRALTDEEIDRFLAAAEADDREAARVFWEQEANAGERWKRRRVGERVPQAPMW